MDNDICSIDLDALRMVVNTSPVIGAYACPVWSIPASGSRSDAMKPAVRPVIRAAQTEPLHTFLSRRGFCFTATEAAALQAAAAADPTIGTTPILYFAADLKLLNRGTFHLIQRGRPLCGCPHATGRALRVDGLEAADWWRLCRRCWCRAEAAGLTSYGV